MLVAQTRDPTTGELSSWKPVSNPAIEGLFSLPDTLKTVEFVFENGTNITFKWEK